MVEFSLPLSRDRAPGARWAPELPAWMPFSIEAVENDPFRNVVRVLITGDGLPWTWQGDEPYRFGSYEEAAARAAKDCWYGDWLFAGAGA